MQALKEIGAVVKNISTRFSQGNGPKYLSYINPYTPQLKWTNDPEKEHFIVLWWVGLLGSFVGLLVARSKYKKSKAAKAKTDTVEAVAPHKDNHH
jgi:hypothetical protein